MAHSLQISQALEVFDRYCPEGFLTMINHARPAPDFVEMRYDMAWVRAYSAEKMIHDDPSAHFVMTRIGHITWRALREANPNNRVMRAMCDHGMETGNTFSLNDHGRKSMITGIGAEWTPEDIRVIDAALRSLDSAVRDQKTVLRRSKRASTMLRKMASRYNKAALRGAPTRPSSRHPR